MLNRNRLLSEQLKDEIIRMLTSEVFETNRLPAESKIAERFNVSSTSVREALAMMRDEGLITKKHGSGNYFHRSVLNAKHRIDQFSGFDKFLEAQGYRVKQIISAPCEISVPVGLHKYLELPAQGKVTYYSCTFFANNNPAIHSDFYLNPIYIKNPLPQKLAAPIPIYDVITQYCAEEYAYGNMEYLPLLSTELESEQIRVPVGVPLVTMGVTYYSRDDHPIAYGMHKFNHSYVTISMISSR